MTRYIMMTTCSIFTICSGRRAGLMVRMSESGYKRSRFNPRFTNYECLTKRTLGNKIKLLYIYSCPAFYVVIQKEVKFMKGCCKYS